MIGALFMTRKRAEKHRKSIVEQEPEIYPSKGLLEQLSGHTVTETGAFGWRHKRVPKNLAIAHISKTRTTRAGVNGMCRSLFPWAA